MSKLKRKEKREKKKDKNPENREIVMIEHGREGGVMQRSR
jgi:hypothetical protein